jgi:hypothetical protein
MASLAHRVIRNRVAYLYIELSRELSKNIGVESMFGTHVDIVLVACAVVIGHTEGRPFTAAKLAQFVGMPRSTALRKLNALVDLGVIENRDGHYCVSKTRLELPDETIQRVVRTITKFSP